MSGKLTTSPLKNVKSSVACSGRNVTFQGLEFSQCKGGSVLHVAVDKKASKGKIQRAMQAGTECSSKDLALEYLCLT